MCTFHNDELWRGFPKTALEFETRFPDEAACRNYFETLRWNGEPACDKCGSKRLWRLNQRPLYDCGECGHQTSLTSGTLLHGTRKPLRMWFRAVLEMTIRRNGISAKDLQRMMAFGSYETAWIPAFARTGSGCIRSGAGFFGKIAILWQKSCSWTKPLLAEKALKKLWFL